MKTKEAKSESNALVRTITETGKIGKKAIFGVGHISKKTVKAIGAGAVELTDQAQAKAYEMRVKHYNPIFLIQLSDPEFKIPMIIKIVDEGNRRNVDVCKGAIGWLSKEKGMEALHLYASCVKASNIKFAPIAQRDAIYLASPYRPNVYVNVDNYFINAQEEKLAELQHIAYSLGAKSYNVEVVTNKTGSISMSAGDKVNVKMVEAKQGFDRDAKSFAVIKSIAGAKFSGTREPVVPELCWFAQDKNMHNLIDMRFSESGNGITEYTIALSNSSAISSNLSAKIQATIFKIGGSSGFDKQCREEREQKMIYKLKF